MDRKVSSMRQRAKLVGRCLDKRYSAKMILELLDRVNEYPEEEREAEATRILAELEDEPAQR